MPLARLHDDRHRRAGARPSRARRRSPSSRRRSRWAAERGLGVVAGRARLEPARRGRGRRRARRPARRRARGGRGARRPARRGRRRDERRLPPPRARGGARRLRVRVRDPRHGRRRRLDERRRVRQRLERDPRPCARRHRRRRRLADAGRARALVPPLRARAGPGRRARSSTGSSRGRSTRSRPTVADLDRAAQGDAADEQAHVRLRLQEPGRRARRGADARGVRPEGAPDRRRA